MAEHFGAILTAMVTPFDAEGRVDEAAAVKLLEHLYGNGSDGVVVCGTTGEAATLDDDEHLGFIELVVGETRRNHPGKTVIAGVGSNDTRHAVKLTERATALGPDGLLSVNPYYNRPSHQGIVAHYAAVTASTDLPILLYNIPQRTGADLSNDFLEKLGQNFENIVGVKQAHAANLAKIDGMMIYAGNDENVIDTLNMGEPGGICTLTHIFGNHFQQMVGEPQNRQAIHDSLLEAFTAFGVAPLAVTNKAALNLIGVPVGGPRLPYVPLDELETAQIKALLERHGLVHAVQA
jgi:4-hydroxy-tetrahydrodipicolinate synthase